MISSVFLVLIKYSKGQELGGNKPKMQHDGILSGPEGNGGRGRSSE